MRNKTTLTMLTAAALLGAALAIHCTSRLGTAAADEAPATWAQSVPQSTEFAFGGLTIGRGQTASIIAILLPDSNNRDLGPVEAEFMFYDWEGNLVASERKTLLPGHPSSFDTHGIIAITPTQNGLLPRLRVLVDPTDPRADRILGTVQVSDGATGKTQVVLSCRKAGATLE